MYHEKPKIQKGNSKWHLTNKERGLYEAEKSKKIKNARNRYHIRPEERDKSLRQHKKNRSCTVSPKELL